jgi:hypothetical protein
LTLDEIFSLSSKEILENILKRIMKKVNPDHPNDFTEKNYPVHFWGKFLAEIDNRIIKLINHPYQAKIYSENEFFTKNLLVPPLEIMENISEQGLKQKLLDQWYEGYKLLGDSIKKDSMIEI